MNKQKSNQMASLRKKLLAAIAMLLVACIMTVSSTYAWFTLSTAPEVKGISTTVGANGNLEMALAYWDTTANNWGDPASAVGNSSANTENGHSVMDSNITWGNLVDLSDGYGLSNITLYPTRLNLTADISDMNNPKAVLNREAPLKFPVYGADGRINTLSASTLLGKYDSGTAGFKTVEGNSVGVSAIGTASSMTEREYAIKNYKYLVSTNISNAKGAAQDAIRDYAGDLAALAINTPNTVTPEQALVLQNLIDRLQDSNQFISDAMVAAVNVIWTTQEVSEETWENLLKGASEEQKNDINLYVAYMTGDGKLASTPDVLTNYLTEQATIKSNLATAENRLAYSPEKPSYDWATVEDVVGTLLNSTGIKIGGWTIDQIREDKSANDAGTTGNGAIADLTSKFTTIEFTFAADSGIFSDIANFTGNYSAPITFPGGTTVEGVPLTVMNGRPVNVYATTEAANGYLNTMYSGIKDSNAYTDTTVTEKVLTDTYGYIVDLLFRTNASDSFLQLQVDAENRYMDGASNATMGGGSNMTFTMGSLTKEQINKIAAGIRVVFFDRASSDNIVAVATLNTSSGTASGSAYKVPLQLVDYTYNTEGALVVTGARVNKSDTVQNESIALCELAANTKTALSALVYLDGDIIDNEDAVLENLVSTLNLQFSSSVELKPMDNEALKNMEATTTTTTTATN